MPAVVDREEKAREICQRAYEVFTTEGIEKFSLNQFIALLGISKGQFYHYFKTKEELIFAAISEKSEWFVKEIKENLKGAKTLIEKLRILFVFYVGEEEEMVRFRRILFDTFHLYIYSKDLKAREFNAKTYEWMDRELEAILKEEIARGHLREEVLEWVEIIPSSVDGIYLHSIMTDGYDLKKALEDLFIKIEKIFGVEGERGRGLDVR